jgi:hypothetical protein
MRDYEAEYRRNLRGIDRLIHPFVRSDPPQWLVVADRSMWVLLVLLWLCLYPPALLLFLLPSTRRAVRGSFCRTGLPR